MTSRIHAGFAAVASLVVGFAVVWGFVLAGSPAARRTQLFDARRLQDLQAIARAIQTQVMETAPTKGADTTKRLKHPLPKTLEEVAEKERFQKIYTHDPETEEPYGYTVVNATTFTLCANFSQAHNADFRVFWNHPAGEHCFTINVLDPPP
jgi:hypothetical protein